MAKKIKFPKDFYWGASTSSHQVEGDNYNNWTEWEQSTQRVESLRSSGRLNKHGLENFLSKKAAGHFNLFKDDYRLAKDLGHNATRFSIEWSRIEPEEGKFDERAIEKYKEILLYIKELGIEPFVTIWHWTIPVWFASKGGWKNRKAPEIFERFVQKVVSSLGKEIKFWITINEPEIYTTFSYYTGAWPPNEKSLIGYLRVLHNLIKAHKRSYLFIKSNFPETKVGIAKNNIYFEPHSSNPVDMGLKKLYDWWWNFYLLNRIDNHQDFIGLNYYFHNRFVWGRIKNENKRISDLGWELHPEGIFPVLSDLSKYNKPIYITENGIADAMDKERASFIINILKHVHKAIEKGVDVKGYLHWSLLDNFEWDSGFYPRFGLVEVDYSSMKRKPRKSALLYKKIIEENGISEEMIKDF